MHLAFISKYKMEKYGPMGFCTDCLAYGIRAPCWPLSFCVSASTCPGPDSTLPHLHLPPHPCHPITTTPHIDALLCDARDECRNLGFSLLCDAVSIAWASLLNQGRAMGCSHSTSSCKTQITIILETPAMASKASLEF